MNNEYYAQQIINNGTVSFTPSFKFFSVTFDANGQDFTDETAPASKLCWSYFSDAWLDRKITKPADPVAKDPNYRFIGWTVGPKRDSGAFDIEPNKKLIIYAKLTDKAGNVKYLSSNGIVLDNLQNCSFV